MKVVVRETDAVRELVIDDASFFARERPFHSGRPFDNIFIDSFGLALNKAVTETKRPFTSRAFGVASFHSGESGAGSWRVTSLTVLRDNMVWIEVVASPFLSQRNMGRRWHCTIMRPLAAAHPWQAVSGPRRNGRAGRRFVPPPFSVIFDLVHYLTNLQELAKPRSSRGDEDGMRLLSLTRKTQSFFDNLEVTFSRRESSVDHPLKKSLPWLGLFRLMMNTVPAHLDELVVV
ncbi:hypothetical protein AMTR_s00100p00118360 [Amborella trichopoda]|uniref:Uncharacterized protein n=1 Tax=Amborella trichopoda TaxID=13333 RepID=W1NT46_AMBTC|nr:hypothetical protein AMTR_s00100p00118360 [Amborella trichopoda]